jgi:lysozyme
LGATALAACAPVPPAGRPAATAIPVDDPSAFGLDAVIDLSQHNKGADLARAGAEGGIRAVIHKATEGVGWVDPTYMARRAQAEAAGLLWGAYHFGTRAYSGTEQAAAFLATVGPGPGTVLALDLELNELNPANSMDLERAEAFVATVQTATGIWPLLYVHPIWADGEPMGGTGRTLGGAITRASPLARCPLWLADYRARPELPTAWAGRGWHLWQYAGSTPGRVSGPFEDRGARVPGIARCDRNLFAGDAAALAAFWAACSRPA